MKKKKKSIPRFVVFIIALVALAACWIPYALSAGRTDMEMLKTNHKDWFEKLNTLTGAIDRSEPDINIIHAKDAVKAGMPAGIAMVAVESSEVPLLTTRYKNPKGYTAFLDCSSAPYWRTYGVFSHNEGSHQGWVLSSWIEAEPGKRHRLLLFLE